MLIVCPRIYENLHAPMFTNTHGRFVVYVSIKPSSSHMEGVLNHLITVQYRNIMHEMLARAKHVWCPFFSTCDRLYEFNNTA